jgi:hypothetical protein
MQQGEARFGYGAAPATKPLHNMPPPSIFGFDASIESSSRGVILSFFAVPVVPSAPTGYKNNFQLGIFMDYFPICAGFLGGVPYTTSELDKLVYEALLSDRFPLRFPYVS